MQFSEGRRSYLAHKILDTLKREQLAEIANERLALNEIKRVFEHEQALDEQVDAVVRKKIASLSRRVPVGSREWQVLYRQYYEEEMRRRRR
jgi:hypothetical protein